MLIWLIIIILLVSISSNSAAERRDRAVEKYMRDLNFKINQKIMKASHKREVETREEREKSYEEFRKARDIPHHYLRYDKLDGYIYEE